MAYEDINKTFDFLQKKMDHDLALMQDEMVRKYTASGTSNNGLITVVVDADHFIKDMKIDPSIAKDDPKQIKEWIREATNKAIFEANLELERRTSAIVLRYLDIAEKK